MKRSLNRTVLILLLLCYAGQHLLPLRSVHAQEPSSDTVVVNQLIAQMTPEQAVGQLFLVTLPGQDISEGSLAVTLVRDLHVGGVALRASNGNYSNAGNTPQELLALTNGLQTLAQAGSTGGESPSPFIPLFIAIDLVSPNSLYADGLPQNGFSPIPSEMAIGATWQRGNAELVGHIVGQELESVGVNMLLGPALDVVDSPRPEAQTNLGTRTFGGDPYWVGEMGEAFIRGVAEGSGGQVATIARHFPGLGSSDRRPDEEIATVQKPLQALQQEDLPPFFAVTHPTFITGTVDGLMTTNLRYRGLQGNIRQITRPISLDPQSLPTLINQPELLPWRQAGGILLSDELGAPALRRFYAQQANDPSFPTLTVARDAFNAGNDLLFLADFALTDNWEERLANIRGTIEYFAEQYRSDPVFKSKVDESLRRLLGLKLRLYQGQFMPESVLRPELATLETSPLQSQSYQSEIARISQEAATLLYPGQEELADRLPAPPLRDETILIVTDARPIRDCATCPERPIMATDELERQLLRLYGPDGGSAQLDPLQMTSLSFDQLHAFLTGGTVEGAPVLNIQATLDRADWVIFLMQNISAEASTSDALRLFLRDFSGQARGQKLIILSFGAPYYLDSTEISKVTAYYGFYTPSAPSVNAAARLLFQEYSATGAAPVTTYPLLNYRLDTQLSPSPNGVIEICLDSAEVPEESCLPVTMDDVQAGGEIALRTTVIRDHNGHPVPDGTIINFILRYPNESNLELPRQAVQTVNGVARARVPLNREGQLAISVASEPPTFTSTTVVVTIQGSNPPEVLTVVPSPTPTASPTVRPTPSTTPRPSPTRRPTPTPEATAVASWQIRFGQANEGFGWWVFLGSIMGLSAVSGFDVAVTPTGRSRRVRRTLMILLYGLGGYVGYLLLYAFRLLPEGFNGWGAIVFAVLGGFIALIHER
ncbi:MAG: hypothetical protein H0T73_23725 [Ardenticatenales bacterium]|nr:hypothetical protein [Ardenticatenales bacterium]